MAASRAERVTAAADFFNTIHGTCDSGLAPLFSLPDQHTNYFDLSKTDALKHMSAKAVELSESKNVYVGVCPLASRPFGGRGTAADVAAIPGFYVDADVNTDRKAGAFASREDAMSTINEMPLPPSLIVNSGNGYQVYWLLHEARVIESEEERAYLASGMRRWESLFKRRGARYGASVDSVAELARILRVPGTLNHKSDPPRPVTIIHDSGARYALADFEDVIPDDLLDDHEDAPIAPAEGEIVLSEHSVNELAAIIATYQVDGTRHSLTRAMSGVLANNGIAHSSARAVIAKASAIAGDRDPKKKLRNVDDTYAKLRAGIRPLGWAELRMIVKDANDLQAIDRILKAEIRKAQPSDETAKTAIHHRLTDTGNGERLADRIKARARYCKRVRAWYAFDGERWDEDHTGSIMREAKASALSINDIISGIEDDKERGQVRKHAERSESERALKAAISLAESEPGISIQINDFDTNLWVLNVKNGTVDLRTGKIRPHDAADLITKLAPIRYDPNATCPRFEAFISEIFDGDDELARFVQKALGHALTGDTSERAVFIAYGAGKNGKSTLANIVKTILGDYALKTPTETLMARKSDGGVPNDVARLKGARFVTASETEENRRLAVAKIKEFSGNEEISARYMRGEWFEFRPHFKLWLSTNHKPVIPGHDRAAWDRVKLIPFTVQIPPERQDKHLEERLLEESPGILRWLIDGCLAWQREGLAEPEAVRDATQDYRSEMDQLGRFLDECCIRKPDAQVSTADLYGAYKAWCETNREHQAPNHTFGRRLGERGFEHKQIGKARTRTWLGIGLLSTSPEPEEHQDEGGEQQRTARNGTFDINGSEYLSRELIEDMPFTTVHRSPSAHFEDVVVP